MQLSETMNMQTASVPKMSAKLDFELIDAKELGHRLMLPASWIFAHTRERVPREERIPHIRFGRYVRFRWDSPELTEWIERHRR